VNSSPDKVKKRLLPMKRKRERWLPLDGMGA
jgi:hypothetical protein